jgi:hypothetical protein
MFTVLFKGSLMLAVVGAVLTLSSSSKISGDMLASIIGQVPASFRKGDTLDPTMDKDMNMQNAEPALKMSQTGDISYKVNFVGDVDYYAAIPFLGTLMR